MMLHVGCHRTEASQNHSETPLHACHKDQTLAPPNASEDAAQQGLSPLGGIKMVQPPWRTVWQCLTSDHPYHVTQ